MISLERLVWQVADHVRRILKEECLITGAVFVKSSDLSGDLVTRTDFAIQDRLQEVLLHLLPDSLFLGEEDFRTPESLIPSPYWIVDPLDGTLNFASGLPLFGASVALVVDGSAVLGVVYDHGNDMLFCGIEGQLPTCNGTPFGWDEASAIRAPIGISSGYLSLMRNHPETFAPDWLGARFRIFGSQALQLCWAAAGNLRLNLNPEAKLWDDAAGALICACAGAGYCAHLSHPLYPLLPDSQGLTGESLFSIAGHPSLVTRCHQLFPNYKITV
jgi:myo-inositol-1(or 4)-monophosphatase